MKKFLAILMAVFCVCSLGVAAIDGDSSASTSGTADVIYGVTEGYTWTMHARIDFGTDAGINQTIGKTVDIEDSAAKITITKNVIEGGKKLQISIASANGYKLVSDNDDELAYTVNKGAEFDSAAILGQNASVLELPSGQAVPVEQALYFQLITPDGQEVAGNYSDTLTYTAAIVA